MTDTLKQWLAANPGDPTRFTQSLAGVARRAIGGEDFHFAVRELLDEFALISRDDQRRKAIEENPPLTGDPRYDAYLGALAEHLAVHNGLRCPEWALADERFLDRFWFVSDVPGCRATALAQAPASFRRRGSFIPARSLTRV